jgi:Ca2+-binding RTX toxin-like protein
VIAAGATVSLNDPAYFEYRQVSFDGYGILLTTTSYDSAPNFFNAGTFDFVDSGLPLIVGIGRTYSGYWSNENSFVNEVTGTFVVENLGGDAVGVFGIAPAFNLGSISVISHGGDAYGFTDLYNGFYSENIFVNAGILTVEADGAAVGLGQLYGSSLTADQVFNSGMIAIHGGEASAGINWLGGAFGGSFVVNSGTIKVTDDTAAKDSAAINVDWGSNDRLWNCGTLEGDFSIRRGHPQSSGTGSLSIYNSGHLNGDVDLYGGSGPTITIINTGSIIGDVKLANGSDLFDGRQGSLTGTLSGMSGNDQLLTGSGAQTILGGNGDDTLSGGAGNDTLTGGAGADHFRYEAGFGVDTITDFDVVTDHVDVRGYTGWQSIAQQGGDVVVTLAAGEQLIFKNQILANITSSLFTFGVAAIADNAIPAAPDAPDAPPIPLSDATAALAPIYGTSAADSLNGTNAHEALAGAGGNDVLNGNGGNDRLDGGTGNDTLDGGGGADLMTGGLGDDTYVVDASDDLITEAAGEGRDLVKASISTLLGANLEDLTLTGSSAISGIGNALDNDIRGNAADNVLSGGLGDDRLFGNAGNDSLTGGAGYDRMYGGLGDDRYYANDADDYAYETAGEGRDQVIASLDHQLRVEVEDLVLTGAAYIGKGNASDNAISGTDNANKLYGYGGNDSLDGGAGNDYLFGDVGNDTLTGGTGYDRMYGGAGDDRYIVTDTTDYTYENAGEGNDRVVASINHVLRANIEELELAGTGDLRGYGNAENNLILGNTSNNLLYGRDGNDTLRGNAGNDILYGENGNDLLDGGAGQDRFYGGAGADDFIFADGDFAGMASSTADRIHDYVAGLDQISLAEVDANSGLAGDQSFVFLGTGAFTGTAGELRTYQASGNTYVQGDVDGDGIGDFLIRLDGLHTLQASDFII